MRILSVDIGSTWTKGAIFELRGGTLHLAARAQTPTTQHLPDGFFAVKKRLEAAGDKNPAVTVWSSSAHGGLAVAAVGIVPDWTLSAARAAALSAGARVTGVFAYELTDGDVQRLNYGRPDIVLLTGGTDGGNRTIVLHNARRLRELKPDICIVYAGNRDVADEVKEILNDHPLVLAENVLPELREPAPESAREAIRQVFLERIAEGKGLSEIIRETNSEPVPTPRAMLEYVEAVGRGGGLGRFLCIDMGGATTDVYSHGEPTPEEEAVLTAGLPEPVTKRTVEGDLGMRVSAPAVAQGARVFVERLRAAAGLPEETFDAWVQAVHAEPARLPQTPVERLCDDVLAQACLGQAVSRHAGRLEVVYTVNGPTEIRKGKDFRGFSTLVCSGGFLSRGMDPVPALHVMPFDERGRIVLTPAAPRVLYDHAYLWPLLANAWRAAPEAAVKAGIAALKENVKRPDETEFSGVES